jgi:hypothetical protein
MWNTKSYPRIASFSIMTHQMGNWEWKFYNAKWLGHKLVFPTNLGGQLSFILSFLFPERSLPPAATYVFIAPTCCTTTIITFKPCALNAEFHHFILSFNKISLLCGHHWKRGYGVKAGRKTVTLRISLLYFKDFLPCGFHIIFLLCSFYLIVFLNFFSIYRIKITVSVCVVGQADLFQTLTTSLIPAIHLHEKAN